MCHARVMDRHKGLSKPASKLSSDLPTSHGGFRLPQAACRTHSTDHGLLALFPVTWFEALALANGPALDRACPLLPWLI